MKRRLRWLKRPQRRERALPLRLWLILAVAAVTGAGFLAQVGLTQPVSLWERQTEDARLADVRQIIGTDPARWQDPAWRRHADASLAALGVEVALFPARPGTLAQAGRAIYLTAGARRLLDTGGQDAPATDQAPDVTQLGPPAQPTFRRLVIAGPARPAGQAPVGVALLWDTPPNPDALFSLVWAAVELGTFALTLAVVVWLIGQPVLRPLAAMGRAAEDIAGGELDVRLPASPVREIAEVSAALEGLSGALREALVGRAALEEERRLFVGAVAHDLRTPLFMLRGYLKGLETGVATTPEKTAHYLDACRVQADALERLVADLFAYARLEYLEQEPERAPLELGALLRESVEGARPRAAARGIALGIEAPAEPCPLLGDGHLLARAVANLLDNALRHTPAGGQIRVRWAREGDTLRFAVADTGSGIAAHDLPHLFTPLYRGEASRNRRTGGAGLGLSIARRIVRAHGGDLTAANGATGGAVFAGTLPAARHPAPRPSDPAAATSGRGP